MDDPEMDEEARLQQRLLIVPTLPTALSNMSTASFTLEESQLGGQRAAASQIGGEAYADEIAKASLTFAADGSFVETSSAVAARELKRRYDLLMNVGQNGIHSPYAITTLTKQTGEVVYRVSERSEQVPNIDQTFLPPVLHGEERGFNSGSLSKAKGTRSRGSFLSPASVFKATLQRPSRRRKSNTSSRSGSSTGPSSPTYIPPPPVPPISAAFASTSHSVPDLSMLLGSESIPPTMAATPTTSRPQSPTRGVISPGFFDTPAPASVAVRPRHSSSPRGPPDDAVIHEPFGPLASFPVPTPPSSHSSPPHIALHISPPSQESEINPSSSQLSPPPAEPYPATKLIPTLRSAQSFDSNMTARVVPRASVNHSPSIDPSPRSPSIASSAEDFDPAIEIFDILQIDAFRLSDYQQSVHDEKEEDNDDLPGSHLPLGAPNRDPRFSIWGHVGLPNARHTPVFRNTPSNTHYRASHPRTGRISSVAPTDASASHSSSSASSPAPSSAPTDDPTSDSSMVSSFFGQNPHGTAKDTLLLAATIERWVAQITSQLNHDELLDFFLTYRAYISPIELLNIFIARFHWALSSPEQSSHSSSTAVNGEEPSDPSNESPRPSKYETVKQIVRVRTFTALRCWLLTFFHVDFLRNPNLGEVLTKWLNALIRSPMMIVYPDARNIVRQLRVIVRQCKVEHYREGTSRVSSERKRSASTSSAPQPPPTAIELTPVLRALLEQTANSTFEPGLDDPDVDLDFSISLTDLQTSMSSSFNVFANASSRPRAGSGSATMSTHDLGSMVPHSAVMSTTQASLLQPLHLAASKKASMSTLSVASSSTAVASTSMSNDTSSTPLPMHHSKVSRAFVNTLGKIGRWKRVLNNRSVVQVPGVVGAGCVRPDEFDLEINSSGDLLTVRGGLEQYLKLMDLPPLPEDEDGADDEGVDELALALALGDDVDDGGDAHQNEGNEPHDEGELSQDPGEQPTSAEHEDEDDAVNVTQEACSELPAEDDAEELSISIEGASSSVDHGHELDVAIEVGSPSAAVLDEDLVHNEPAQVEETVESAEDIDIPDESESAVEPLASEQPIESGQMQESPVLSGTVPAEEIGESDLGERPSPQADTDLTTHDTPALPPGLTFRPDVPQDVSAEPQPPPSSKEPYAPEATPFQPQWRQNPLQGYSDFTRQSIASYRSSISSMGELLPRRSFTLATHPPPPGRFRVVPVDDYEFSDSEDEDLDAEHGLQRTARRLPNRRDFAFVRRSANSMSLFLEQNSISSDRRASEAIQGEAEEEEDDGEEGSSIPAKIEQWQLRVADWESDDETSGDAQTALQRLEGGLNVTRQQEYNRQLADVWMERVMARLEAERRGVDFSEEDARWEAEHGAPNVDDTDILPREKEGLGAGADSIGESDDVGVGAVVTDPSSDVFAKDTAPDDSTVTPTVGVVGNDPIPVEDEAAEDEQGADTGTISTTPIGTTPRMSPLSISDSAVPTRASLAGAVYSPSKFTMPHIPIRHYSFILQHRSQSLAGHFSMIDRELFLALQFQQLVSAEPHLPMTETPVYDWEAFLKRRAIQKHDARNNPDIDIPLISDVSAIRARLDLVSSFVASEIILTHLSERVTLVGKFIRLAWKLFQMHSFASLVAVISGLTADVVVLAMRRLWSRVGKWEQRIFTDLKTWTSSKGNYFHIREATTTLTEQRALLDPSKDVKSPACIPLLNVYLNELREYNSLPHFIDPTAPYSAYVSGAPLKAPEVFADLVPLPASIPLQPFLNIHKQRLIAGLIKTIVSGQHLASAFSVDIDPQLYQKCLRLRALDPATMRRVITISVAI